MGVGDLGYADDVMMGRISPGEPQPYYDDYSSALRYDSMSREISRMQPVSRRTNPYQSGVMHPKDSIILRLQEQVEYLLYEVDKLKDDGVKINGWICPKCSKTHSPVTKSCMCDKVKIIGIK